MDTYTQMVDCPEIQGQRTDKEDSRYCVKEDIWGFSDQDAEDRKQDAKSHGAFYARRHPEKPPYKQDPLLKVGDIVICAEMLGVEDSNEIQVTVWTVLQNYPDKFIWLPRQEDIQEMLKPIGENHYGLLDRFDGWIESIAPLYHSITELWLGFYMWEVHKKIWTEKGWV